jgi:hypothetical protein
MKAYLLAAFALMTATSFAQGDVMHRVVHVNRVVRWANGKPAKGVTVLVNGVGRMTDRDGTFSITTSGSSVPSLQFIGPKGQHYSRDYAAEAKIRERRDYAYIIH